MDDPNDPNILAESRQEAKERRARELYARVRNYDHKLYGDICAFAGTLDIPGTQVTDQSMLEVRAKIEAYCISLVAQMLERAADAPYHGRR